MSIDNVGAGRGRRKVSVPSGARISGAASDYFTYRGLHR